MDYCKKKGGEPVGICGGREPAKRTIGVLGSERGVGVTQLCIALANFISLESGGEVQLLDVSKTGQLAHVPTTADGKLFGVEYFVDVQKKQIPSLMSRDHDYMILDLGSSREDNYAEFLRCTKKIVVGSFCLWKRQAYDDLMQFVKNEASYTDWEFCELFGKKEDKKEFKKKYGVPLRTIPFLRDPYHLRQEDFLFLKEFTRGL